MHGAVHGAFHKQGSKVKVCLEMNTRAQQHSSALQPQGDDSGRRDDMCMPFLFQYPSLSQQYLYRSFASHGVLVSVIDPANISSPITIMAAFGASMGTELAALTRKRE